MKMPAVTGTIKRRLLVNYRVLPAALQSLLPEPFRPKLCCGYGVAGICLIRLEHERPAGVPSLLGLSSENAAHRIAVEWTEPDGKVREGVYVPRRDTDSLISRVAGGRLFAGEYHAARFHVLDEGGRIDFRMESGDGEVGVRIVARESDTLPDGSIFSSLEEASEFFEAGSLGYSPSGSGADLDGIELVTDAWNVRPLEVKEVKTNFFDDSSRFPEGTVAFDHALIMRDIPHEWRQQKSVRPKDV